MASIQRLTSKLTGETSYRVQVRVKGFPSQSGSFTDKGLAKKWAKTTEAAMIEGRTLKNGAGRHKSVGEGAIRYAREILHVELPEYEPTREYEQRLAAWLEQPWTQPTHPDTPADAKNSLARLMWWRAELRDLKMSNVTDDLVEEKLSKLRTEPFQRSKPDSKNSVVHGQSPRMFPRREKTVNRYIAAGSKFFRIAHKRWKWIGANPFSGIERTHEGNGRMKLLTVVQRTKLFNEVRSDPTLFAFSMTARATVARAGDMQKLLKEDVEFFDGEGGELLGRIAIRMPKNQEPRVVWIAGEPAQILRAHIASSATDEPRVFVSPGRVYPKAGLRRAGKLFRYNNAFKEACQRASVPSFTFHGWRHDGATDLARLGATEQQLKAIGGWKSNVVRKYVHLAAEDAKGILLQMNHNLITHKGE